MLGHSWGFRMILMRDLKVTKIVDDYYKIRCSRTHLEATGHGLQKVAKELNQKGKDRIRANALRASQNNTYTTTGSSVGFV